MALGPGADAGKAVVDAILSAFDKAQLSGLLRYKGGMVLEDEVDTAAPFRRIAQDLVVLLDQNGDVDPFITLALSEKPGNPKLRQLAADRGLEPPAPTMPAHAAMAGTVTDFIAAAHHALPSNPALDAVALRLGATATTAPAGLEALVARRSRLIDFARFQLRLAQMEARTCLIRTPQSLGTGFLVGPDRVLTNYHVVRDMIDGAGGPDTVSCEFDFNGAAPQPLRVALAGRPVASSPFSASDLSGDGLPGEHELDYALLPLASAIGATDRGFYPLDPVPRLLALNDFVFVCQHANGQALTLAMGTITDFPGKALRIRYDATTDHGSSGSPCLNADLDLIGLHHAADPAAQPRYNQAVPTWLIARHVAATGVTL